MRVRRNLLLAAATLLLLPLGTYAPAAGADEAQTATSSPPNGSFALSGAAAARFVLPDDMALLHHATLPDGRTATRYQQRVSGAAVIGSQITVLASAAGETVAVIGQYAAGVRPSNGLRLTKHEARAEAAGRVGDRGTWSEQLRIEPVSGRFVYEVTSRRSGGAPVLWVDAENGSVRRTFDLRHHGEGTGVKGDQKGFTTTAVRGTYLLRSPDGRAATYDNYNRKPGHATVLMTDANDRWDLRANWVSPDQRAGVDAFYYATVVDRFYGEVFGRDSLDDQGVPLLSVVHVDSEVCNAFWDGTGALFGDGFSAKRAKETGRTCQPLSGALDVVAHEFTHGVTQYTSRLFAGPESVSLNEGFSDVMGASVEFFAAANGLDPAVSPDWAFGEDVVDSRSSTPGFRNLAEPRLLGGLDHYSELPLTTAPHRRGTIAGHAFQLLSDGGGNSGCVASATHAVTHTADCGVVVPAIGIGRAGQVFYAGFTSLQETANFCDARNATVAVAGSDAVAADLAWQAVGVHADCAPTPPPAPACVDVPDAQLPFESAHPYANDSSCTWTYDNGVGGFAFHFSLLDVETDYDFVEVLDANGAVLATYTGNYGSNAPPTCVPTSVGSVRLTSDQSFTRAGFTVDAVGPC